MIIFCPGERCSVSDRMLHWHWSKRPRFFWPAWQAPVSALHQVQLVFRF